MIARFFRLFCFLRLITAQDKLFFTSNHFLRKIFTLGIKQSPSHPDDNFLSKKIQKLGASYVKLGQSLATRPDIVGDKLAKDLQNLQDRLPAFSMKEVDQIIRTQYGQEKEEIFSYFSAPVASASIAQVHHAKLKDGTEIAVKILRPNIKKTLHKELKLFSALTKLGEMLIPSLRRLKPRSFVQTLCDGVIQETDLRLEAAALSQIYDNLKQDSDTQVPKVIWEYTTKEILTMQWVEGIKASDIDALKKEKLDLPLLAKNLLQGFLRQALKDGFFHADMHQGNILISKKGVIVLLDLGITGRLDEETRYFFAQIIYGFVTRDYDLIARVHFEAGYVPSTQNIGDFSQALRSIGEPIHGQNADKISMALLLQQLFEVTEQFQMKAQPQLFLLQKTMVVVEGVARNLDPKINIWDAAKPLVSSWVKKEMGAEAFVKKTVNMAKDLHYVLEKLPETIDSVKSYQDKLDKAFTLQGTKLQTSSSQRILLWVTMILALFALLGHFILQ